MPGHHDAGNEYTSLEDAETAAIFVKEQGLGGTLYTLQCTFNFLFILLFCKPQLEAQGQILVKQTGPAIVVIIGRVLRLRRNTH